MDKRKFNGKSEKSRKAQKDRIQIKASRDDVLNLYNQQKLTLNQIGKLYNVSAATVLKYFRDNDIPTRSKSEIQKERMSCSITREKLRISSTKAYLKRRKFGTKPELHFEEWLKSNNIRYTTQYRKIGNKHPYDFFLKDYNLIVEIDGNYWHSKEKQKEKDIKHTNDAIDKGYNIIRIDTEFLKTTSYETILEDYLGFNVTNGCRIKESIHPNKK